MAPGDVKIKFLTDYTVKNPESPDEYKEGKVYEMNEASAAHFVRRGVAEYRVKGKKPPAAPTRQPFRPAEEVGDADDAPPATDDAPPAP